MKKFLVFSLTLLTPFLFSFTSSKPDFEGKLVYDITINSSNMPEQAKAMFDGSQVIIYVKGMMTRAEMNMAMQNTISISDRKANTSVTLMDIMGSKYMIKSDINKKETEKAPEVTVKELNETKTIAGYLCKKAEILFKDKSGKEKSTIIFYSEEITNQMGYDKRNYFLKDIKGMPLEYEITTDNGMTMKMTAKTISKESIADSKFEIPTGYKETTAEDLQKDMMKMMQQH